MTRTRIVLIAIALVLYGYPEATSQTIRVKRCEWSWLQDQGRPDLGKDGEVKMDDKGWKAMQDGGWELKKVTYDYIYLFERCV